MQVVNNMDWGRITGIVVFSLGVIANGVFLVYMPDLQPKRTDHITMMILGIGIYLFSRKW